jgi:hypothetical protein
MRKVLLPGGNISLITTPETTMLNRLRIILPLMTIAALFPVSANAYDFYFGDSAYLELKGDLTYSVKYRVENPDSDLKKDSKGNSNFDKGDLVNNKVIGKMEAFFDAPYVSLFGRFEGFYDDVYGDDDLYPEGTDISDANDHAEQSLEALEYYIDLHSDRTTLRVGKQIVEWGELAAPVFAPGVNVMNMYDGTRVGAAGYTIRDYKVPATSAWMIVEVSENLSLEAVYSQDFEPRSIVPVVGTFASFVDQLGFGGPTLLEDKRPRSAKDQEQYGGAIKTSFPSFGNLELGLYYAHYLNSFPMMDAFNDQMTYEEIDMYGFTLSRVIKEWQVYGEFSYRPNQAAQIALGGLFGGAPIGGFEDVRTLNWGVGGMKINSDFFPAMPFTVTFTPLIEVYGGINLDHDDLDGNDSMAFNVPEHTAYYLASFDFSSSDMIDNTTFTWNSAFTGALHSKENSFHSIGNTLRARIGNNLELMLGYDIKLGNTKKAGLNDYPGGIPDRDALSLGITWYFM